MSKMNFIHEAYQHSPVSAQMLGDAPACHSSLDSLPNQSQRMISFLCVSFDCDMVHPGGNATWFRYQADSAVFDSGKLVVIHYTRNTEKQDCEENFVFDEAPLRDKFLNEEIIPRLNKLNLPSIAHFNMKTLKQSISLIPIQGPKVEYLPVPPSLSLPRVPISKLRRIRHLAFARVDLVTVCDNDDNELYAFKHRGLDPVCEMTNSTLQQNLFTELTIHLDIHSPFILRPSAIVTDAANKKFRGLLMPYLPGGTLSDVFQKLHGITDDDDPLELPSKGVEDNWDGLPLGRVKLPWDIKHTWAIETTSAIATLHEQNIFCGDIKSANILLDRSGHLQMIDVAPCDGYTETYAPPDIETSLMERTAARDIFALGLVLWQIASEIEWFERDFEAFPSLVWRGSEGDNDDAGPEWYRSLVESCLHEESGKRPSAQYILSVLEKKRSEGW